MAVLADTNVGFKGEVTSADTPTIFGKGSRYSVEGAGDLKVTAGGSGDRAVTVAAGSAWGDGVLSTWESSTNLNAPLNDGGTLRWDTVVIRREWTPAGTPTGTATLMILTGGGSQAISTARTVDRGKTTSDQPLALIRINAGAGTVAEVVDLRCWAGDGGLVAAHIDARQYLNDPGTQVRIGGSLWTRVIDNLGTPVWSSAPAVDEPEVVTDPSAFLGGAFGWSGTTAGSNSRLTIRNGWAHMSFRVRRSSTSLPNGSSDQVMATLTRNIPTVDITAAGIYYTDDNATNGCWVTLSSSGGNITLRDMNAGRPGIDYREPGNTSVQCDFFWPIA